MKDLAEMDTDEWSRILNILERIIVDRKFSEDEISGLYTVTEAGGYFGDSAGEDFRVAVMSWTDILCWTTWLPLPMNPKSQSERMFIAQRRSFLFEGAFKRVEKRYEIAARVNRSAFWRLKNSLSGPPLRRFDIFNFT